MRIGVGLWNVLKILVVCGHYKFSVNQYVWIILDDIGASFCGVGATVVAVLR